MTTWLRDCLDTEIYCIRRPGYEITDCNAYGNLIKMGKDYASWSLGALKVELSKRNAKQTGKKAVLVQRLQEYDLLFGDIVNNSESAFKIQAPDAKLFRDVNTDICLPIFEEQDLHTFCTITEKEDNEHGFKMYKENYLLTFRMTVDGTYTFISSKCASEMRKTISYNILIKYEEHTIVETQCECAAGMGPHAQCKHVITALYGLIDFTSNKKINVRSSCTSSLQTFHHPTKYYKGSPVKAEELKLKENDANFKEIIKFDPRPTGSDDKKYMEFFKNHCVNFCALQNRPMPIAQIIKAANKKALYQDHDYMEKTHEEKFFDDLKLTPEQQKELEKLTRNDKKIWKKERLMRMQSSNFGKICKAKDKQKQNLAKSLLKNVEVIAPAIQHGWKYEKKALKKFTQLTGLDVMKCGIIIHSELQFIASTPDGLIGEDCLIEVKCPFSAANDRITPESINYIELCEESGQWRLKSSHDYYYQVQGQLLCTNRSLCYFCIYTFKDFCIIRIKRDEDFIKAMIEKICNFYESTYKNLFLYRHFYK